MSSEKPKTEMKHPHNKSNVPEAARPKKKHALRNAALGLAAAAGLGGLAGGCAPSARAQETTPRPRIEMVQAPEARVAPATVPSTRVAEATIPRTQIGYDQTSVGSGSGVGPLPRPEGRVYDINVVDEQPIPLTGEQVKRDYGYMFQNSLVVGMQTLSPGTKVTIGDWEVEVVERWVNTLDIIVRNRSLNYEVATTTADGSRVGALPFPETTNAAGPMFFIAGNGYTQVFYKNNITGRAGYSAFRYDNLFGSPEVGTDVYQGEPYIVVVPPNTRTSDGDLLPGTRIFQFVLAVTQRDGDGPAGGTTYNVRQ